MNGGDRHGRYYRFGASGHKYYYRAGDSKGRAKAREAAARQGRAIEVSKHAHYR
jgi:hypothetical protein